MTDFLLENSVYLGAIAFVLVWIGYAVRKKRRLHVPIMLCAFVIDITNVLVIELNRDAIRQAMETSTSAGEWLAKIHILASIVCVVSYLVAIVTGTLLVKTKILGRKLHRRNAYVFLVSRTINFVTSFWM